MNVNYDTDGRMLLDLPECDCPCEHGTPKQDIYVGSGLIPNLPRYIRRRALGSHCIVVCDRNTYRVAGEQVFRVLRDAGFDAVLLRLEREGEVVPDERTIGELLLTITEETEFLVAVGSGSITDTCRVNAARCRLPFVSVGTAASMDGYTSVVAPLMFKGVKIHRAGPCPEIILCDTEVLKTAPIEMVRSGFGDVLAKYIAIADWQIGNIINDEPFCPTCASIVLDAIGRMRENVDEIARRTEKGMQVLIEGLLLSGITIMIVGHTRAVASVEHNIGHFVEMKMLERYGRSPAHGAVAGACTLAVYPFFKAFAGTDLSAIDPDSLEGTDREARTRFMLDTWGKAGGQMIMDENPGDFLTAEERRRRAAAAIRRMDEIRAVIDAMPPYEDLVRDMKRLGAPLTLQELGVDDDIARTGILCAKDYRTRYTLFKLMDELGLKGPWNE